MKRMLILSSMLLALAISAGAQGLVNFSDLPDMFSPTPMANGYANLNWTGFYYVDPFHWPGGGQGFKHKEWMMGPDVVFAPYGCPGMSCFASLSWVGGSSFTPPPPVIGFQIVSAMAAGGYGKNPLVVTAYYNGKYVGSQRYMMTTDVQELDFPPSWGTVTQVVFEGSVVLYDVTVYTVR